MCQKSNRHQTQSLGGSVVSTCGEELDKDIGNIIVHMRLEIKVKLTQGKRMRMKSTIADKWV